MKFVGESPALLYSTVPGRLLADKLLKHPNTCRRLSPHCFRDGRIELVIDGLTITWPDTDSDCYWAHRLAQLARFAALILAPPRAEHTDYAWSLFIAADALAPQADHEAKLALTGLRFLRSWPHVRRIQEITLRRLRIPTA
jgi:hypothetical protein